MNATQSILEEIETLLLEGDLAHAIRKLENLRRRLDGCGGRPDVNDWVIDCAAQVEIRALVDLLLGNLTS